MCVKSDTPSQAFSFTVKKSECHPWVLEWLKEIVGSLRSRFGRVLNKTVDICRRETPPFPDCSAVGHMSAKRFDSPPEPRTPAELESKVQIKCTEEWAHDCFTYTYFRILWTKGPPCRTVLQGFWLALFGDRGREACLILGLSTKCLTVSSMSVFSGTKVRSLDGPILWFESVL